MTARSVWCRGSAVRAPEVSSRNRSSSRAAISAGLSVRSRAAASSMGSGWPSCRSEPGAHGGAAVEEQPHRVVVGERLEGVQRLPGDAQRFPTGGEHPQLRAGRQQLGDQRGNPVDEVLAVIQHEHQVTSGDCAQQPLGGGRRRLLRVVAAQPHLRTADRSEQGQGQLVGTGDGSELGGARDAADEHLLGQPGLARPAGTGQRHQPDPRQQLAHPPDVPAASHKTRQPSHEPPPAWRHIGPLTGSCTPICLHVGGVEVLVAQHGEVGGGEFGAGVHAEFLSEP